MTQQAPGIIRSLSSVKAIQRKSGGAAVSVVQTTYEARAVQPRHCWPRGNHRGTASGRCNELAHCCREPVTARRSYYQCMQAWPGGHCVEAAERAVPVGPVTGLDQGEESQQCSHDPRTGSGVARVLGPRLLSPAADMERVRLRGKTASNKDPPQLSRPLRACSPFNVLCWRHSPRRTGKRRREEAPMPSRHDIFCCFCLSCSPAFAQPAPSVTEQLQARIDAVALAWHRD
jgi:hypothetical protein